MVCYFAGICQLSSSSIPKAVSPLSWVWAIKQISKKCRKLSKQPLNHLIARIHIRLYTPVCYVRLCEQLINIFPYDYLAIFHKPRSTVRTRPLTSHSFHFFIADLTLYGILIYHISPPWSYPCNKHWFPVFLFILHFWPCCASFESKLSHLTGSNWTCQNLIKINN